MCVKEDEKLIVYKVINKDYTVLQFMLEMAKENYLFMSDRNWPTVNIMGYITLTPGFYFYLTGVYKDIRNGGRRVSIGIINRVYELFAEVDVYFRIYPAKSPYLCGFVREYTQPYMYVESQIKVSCITDENIIFTSTVNSYIRRRVEPVLLLVSQLYYCYDENEIVKQCLQRHSVLLSARLMQVLKYTRGLLMRVYGYMSLWCNCGAFRANIARRCKCEGLIVFVRDYYYCDADQICNDALYFNSGE